MTLSEQKMKQVMRISVDTITAQLTNSELAALNNVVQLDMNPHGLAYYHEVEPLFTENNGARVHEETKAALTAIVIHRLG